MRLGLAQLALGAAVASIGFSACGGATGRRSQTTDADAGEPAAMAGSGNGGSRDQPSGPDSGAASSGVAGVESVTQGGGAVGGAPLVTGGGESAGGEPPLQGGSSGSGGEPSSAGGAGQGGQLAGAGGEGGTPPLCCQPRQCVDVLEGVECASNAFRDNCGKSFFCGCPQGETCVDNDCVACELGPDPCADVLACGAHSDACGKIVDCASDCVEAVGPLGVCHDGRCCAKSKTACGPDDCGYMSDGCGAFIDCTASTCQDGTCQLNGKCCTPSVVCLPFDCGYIDDGCGNVLNCGNDCAADEACLDNHCEPSICNFGAECGSVYNPYVAGFEHCGTCPDGEVCGGSQCLPLCQ